MSQETNAASRFRSLLASERRTEDPEAEVEELALIYRAKGLDPVEGERAAAMNGFVNGGQ